MTELEEIERRLLKREQGESPDMVTMGYARRLGRLFPRMVERAETLRVLPAQEPVPGEVQDYLREASRCYIYGQFIACLIVCRSAIEFAIGDCLRRHGKGKELEELRMGKKDSLENMIDLGRKELSWTLRPTLDDSDQVRIKANAAVHARPPDADACKEMFLKTRGVLRELYSH